jgi:hypothetical protein
VLEIEGIQLSAPTGPEVTGAAESPMSGFAQVVVIQANVRAAVQFFRVGFRGEPTALEKDDLQRRRPGEAKSG